ncbi:BC1872 family protein [Hymenobacter aerilatus]|uniref:BC1872 family protein n=1 Tax=Hymenobacter aerilatus TaxID=2932251 RepID=UPI0035CB17FD
MTLTKELIDSTPVGRELDALVAEYLMGWQFCAVNEPFRFHKERGGLILEGKHPERFPDSGGTIPNRWQPSTSIADAWQVVEHLNKSHYLEMMQAWISGGSDGGELGFKISFRRFKEYESTQDVLSATAPEAICRAALLTVL